MSKGGNQGGAEGGGSEGRTLGKRQILRGQIVFVLWQLILITIDIRFNTIKGNV